MVFYLETNMESLFKFRQSASYGDQYNNNNNNTNNANDIYYLNQQNIQQHFESFSLVSIGWMWVFGNWILIGKRGLLRDTIYGVKIKNYLRQYLQMQDCLK